MDEIPAWLDRLSTWATWIAAFLVVLLVGLIVWRT